MFFAQNLNIGPKVGPAPMLFQSKLGCDPLVCVTENADQGNESDVESKRGTSGAIRYKLSDRTFIEKGWTVLPMEKVVRKKNVFRVFPADPETDWFTNNKDKGLMTYQSGEKLAEFDDNGRGSWYYKNGRLALKYYDSEEANTNQRYVLYSSGEPDEKGRFRPVTVLAMFDQLGNGVVFDHAGKIRLKYDQSDGVVLDRALGPVSRWKWHSLNDPPVLQRVMMDTYMEMKDPAVLNLEPPDHKKPREDFPDMLTIELNNCVKEQRKKMSQKFQSYQIKMKALKINEQFSLRILNQSKIYLYFRDGSSFLKLNLGMLIDNHQILNITTEEAGNVSNSLETIHDQSESILDLQRQLNKVRQFHQARINRELRIRPVIAKASVVRLTAPLSRPIYTVWTQNNNCEHSSSRKPMQTNLYYDNRLCYQ